ncbi:TetR/AcrR family transcriptional regulator [Streptomyces stelliscabiei]
MAGRAKLDDAPERLVRAAIGLLAEQGPSAIKARTVASASGLSTMVVYSHFGGIPELMGAVADRGFQELGRAFAQVPVTDDPIADLFAMALSCRRLARENPHLYDLMFGLSTRATYRPLTEADHRLSGHSSAFRDAPRSYHPRHADDSRAPAGSNSRNPRSWPRSCGAWCTDTSPSNWARTSSSSRTRWRRCLCRWV